jgi:membrane protein implicated in regulation of membrane protease activity
VKRFVGENSLTLAFGLILLLALVGQSVAGLADFNDQQLSQGQEVITYLQYLTSSDFAVDVAENWQSEFLQFFLYIYATVYLIQRGSSESKEPGETGLESDEDQLVGRFATANSPRWARRDGWRLSVYSRSLGLVMGAIFLLSWIAQSVAGRAAYNAQQLSQFEDPVSWFGYVGSPDFWSRTLQNWQSEFLAVAAMSAFSIYLRQRGSPESKPVGSPHATTGQQG